jgi:hypothetical protein
MRPKLAEQKSGRWHRRHFHPEGGHTSGIASRVDFNDRNPTHDDVLNASKSVYPSTLVRDLFICPTSL